MTLGAGYVWEGFERSGGMTEEVEMEGGLDKLNGVAKNCDTKLAAEYDIEAL